MNATEAREIADEIILKMLKDPMLNYSIARGIITAYGQGVQDGITQLSNKLDEVKA